MLDHSPEDCAFPGTPRFPRLLGTNATYRRSALLEIGGFDEAFNYYLDEADVCMRLTEAGYLIRHRRIWSGAEKLSDQGFRDRGADD